MLMLGSITDLLTKFKEFLDSSEELLRGLVSGDGFRKRKASEIDEDVQVINFSVLLILFLTYLFIFVMI